jgi:glycosyltransferase involved in cell wall biosynthesis
MRILFLHQNFPGQFLHAASALRKQGSHELVAVVPTGNTRPPLIPTRTYRFDARKAPANEPLAQHYAERVGRGAAVAQELWAMRKEGFVPDLVIGHGGWGETLFVRDVSPNCHVLLHAEFYYSAAGADAGFDPEFAGLPDDLLGIRVRSRNAAMALALLDADRGVAPTYWQASRFPDSLRPKITIAHEGINTSLLRPSANAEIKLHRDGLTFHPGDEVITFVNRNLEPHRGYHIFMRALPSILARRPNAHAVIVGGDEASYGPPKSKRRMGATHQTNRMPWVGPILRFFDAVMCTFAGHLVRHKAA